MGKFSEKEEEEIEAELQQLLELESLEVDLPNAPTTEHTMPETEQIPEKSPEKEKRIALTE
jgi:hypothetical protein